MTADDPDMVALRHDLFRFANLQLRDAELAEDAVQETLLAALDSDGRFAGKFSGKSQLKTWLIGILRNKIIDILRSRRKTVSISAFAEEDAALDDAYDALFTQNAHWLPQNRPGDWGKPEEALEQQQFLAVLDACLNHLPETTARVFMMREVLELDTGEICIELGIGASNCHVILHRARNALRVCLNQSWFGGAAA